MNILQGRNFASKNGGTKLLLPFPRLFSLNVKRERQKVGYASVTPMVLCSIGNVLLISF
jgi:hypothetical protein